MEQRLETGIHIAGIANVLNSLYMLSEHAQGLGIFEVQR